MGEAKSSGSLMPISSLIVLLAAIGFVFNPQSPLKSTRPYSTELQQERYEHVRARLWQDPFCAVLEHAKSSDGSTQAAGHIDLSDQVKNNNNTMKMGSELEKQTNDKKNKLTVLGCSINNDNETLFS